jgi:hypothetical protein
MSPGSRPIDDDLFRLPHSRKNHQQASQTLFPETGAVLLDGTDNGRPLYRERYVGREEETPEVGGDEELRRSTGDEERSEASGWDDDVE